MSASRQERVRLRFEDFSLDRGSDGRCHARVVLEWIEGNRFTGEADGLSTPQGELRCAGQAAMEAVRDSVREQLELQLVGLKSVRAFDGTVVIASVKAQQGEEVTRLLGSCCAPKGDAGRGAVMAILDATNRVLEGHFNPA